MDKLINRLVFVFALASTMAHAYVYDRDVKTGNPIRQNVTIDNPKVYFRISGSAPAFKNKEQFLDGRYKDLTDDAFFRAVVLEAMKKWNDVEDSFVELALSAEPGPGTSPDDKINNITISSGSWSDAGSAMATSGKTDEDSQFIVDCDINLDSDTDADRFAFTILHELGHCLGLLHPHYSTKAVMSYARLDKKLELAADDKAGITVLYPVNYEKRQNLIPVCGQVAAVAGAHEITRQNNGSAFALLLLPLLALFSSKLRQRKKQN